MKRGELYRVRRPGPPDPKRSRVFVIVGRQVVIDSPFPTVTCAPVFSSHHGLSSQVAVGIDEGLKHASSIHCDELVSLPKSALTAYVGELSVPKLVELRSALRTALAIE